MQKIKIGMVGTGFMARTHSLAYTTLPYYTWPLKLEPEKYIIADISNELASESATRFGYEKYTDDWRDIINDPSVDIVDIVVPNDLHAEIAIKAAEKGKHVICEKPLGRTADEAKTMLEAVEKAKVKHLVAYNYRRAPAVLEAKKLIDEGLIGNIYHFRGFYLQDYAIDPDLPLSWRFQKNLAGSGSLGDIGSHTLDMALFLVGDVDAVIGQMKTFISERPKAGTAKDVLATKRDAGAALKDKGSVDVDDVTSFLLDFKNGATGTLEATRFAYGRKNHLSFEINGDKGSLGFNWERPAELRFYSSEDADDQQGFRTILTGPSHPSGDLLWPLSGFGIGYPETTMLMINDFLNCIAEDKKCSTSFEEGYKNCLIMDAVVESASKNAKVKI